MPRKNENPHALQTIRQAMRLPNRRKVSQIAFAELLKEPRSTIQAIEQNREDLGGIFDDELAEKVFSISGGVVLPFKIEFLGLDGKIHPAVVPAPGEALDFQGNPYTEDSYRRWLEFKAPSGEKNPALREVIKSDLLLRLEALIDAAGESAIGEVEYQVMGLLQTLRKNLGLQSKIEIAMKRLSDEKAESRNVADLETLDLMLFGFSMSKKQLDDELLEALKRDLESKGVTKVKLVKNASWPMDLLSDAPGSRAAARKLSAREDVQPQARLVCLREDGTRERTIKLFQIHDDPGAP